jgi:hypothetical protein
MKPNTATKPTELTPFLASQICDRIIYGVTLTAICDEPEMPTLRTVYRWLETNDAFAKELETARRFAADWIADECIELLKNKGNEAPEMLRLRIETRQWLCGVLHPERYGKRVINEGTVTYAVTSAAA